MGRIRPMSARIPLARAPGDLLKTGLPVPDHAWGPDIVIVGTREYVPKTNGVEWKYRLVDQA